MEGWGWVKCIVTVFLTFTDMSSDGVKEKAFFHFWSGFKEKVPNTS